MGKKITADVRERVVRLYFVDGMIPKDIAVQEGVSDTAVSRIIMTHTPTEFGQAFISNVVSFVARNKCSYDRAAVRFHVPDSGTVESWCVSNAESTSVEDVMKVATLPVRGPADFKRDLGNALMQIGIAFERLANTIFKSLK